MHGNPFSRLDDTLDNKYHRFKEKCSNITATAILTVPEYQHVRL